MRKILEFKKISGPKIFGVHKNSGPKKIGFLKHLGSEKNSGPQNLGFNKIWGPKKCLVEKKIYG